MEYIKPKGLKVGDTVAVISPSWGGPSVFPTVYDNGLKILNEWGLKIKGYPTARMDAGFLRDNPEIRAKDINDAFFDKEVKAIFTSIGGNDSIRILPFIDKEIIRNNPKILIGYSDTTAIHTFLNLNGVVSFYGPSVMAGFSQMKALPVEFEKHIKEMLFEAKREYEYKAYGKYCDGYPNWIQPENLGKANELKNNMGWKWLQGKGKVQGEIFGGCLEVLEMLKGTEFWPNNEFWNDKIFFIETSEDKPDLNHIEAELRNYAMLGVFDKISGFVFGRARDYTDEEKIELENLILKAINKECRKNDLPIVYNFDIGHTDPQFVLPLGIKMEIDCDNKKIGLVENWIE